MLCRLTRFTALAATLAFISLLLYANAALGQPTPTPDYMSLVDAKCGTGMIAKMSDLEKRIVTDQDASDDQRELGDAQNLAALADFCLFALPPCASDSGPCDAAAQVYVSTELLVGQSALAHATAESKAKHAIQSLPQLLHNEIGSAVDLCDMPSITKIGDPYEHARTTIKATLVIASRLHQLGPNSPAEYYLMQLQTCADRIGDSGVSF